MSSEIRSADIAIQDLIRRGAALLIRLDPTLVPVTFWRRVDPERHFYFTTGQDEFAGHILAFAKERVLYDGDAVEFLDKDGALVAYLVPVDDQEDDPEARATLGKSIQDWKDHFDREQNFRAYVMAQWHRSSVGNPFPNIK